MKRNSKKLDRTLYNLQNRVRRKVGKAILEYGMIAPDDCIMVGLSGGKDSLALIDLLADRRRKMPFKFRIIAAHIAIDEIGYSVDLSFLKSFCDDRDVEFVIHHAELTIDQTKKDKNKCFICSWNRRKSLFELAQKYDCSKLALGHHMDDAVHTLLMNMVFQGSISAMPASLAMFDGKIEIIRPMLTVTEEELKGYMKIRGLSDCTVKSCPHEKHSNRDEMKQIVALMEKLNPQVRHTIFGAMTNIQTDYLPFKEAP